MTPLELLREARARVAVVVVELEQDEVGVAYQVALDLESELGAALDELERAA